jgi:hypothetical protein
VKNITYLREEFSTFVQAVARAIGNGQCLIHEGFTAEVAARVSGPMDASYYVVTNTVEEYAYIAVPYTGPVVLFLDSAFS